jgi:hypothetical protein
VTTITKRISSPPAADATKRVATAGATADAGPFLGGNVWGGSWGNSWGSTWLFGTLLIPGTPAEPAIDVTARVGEAAVADNTSRVSEAPLGTNITSSIHHLLLLEGDESGYLLLEGDAVDLETDALELEGDATAITANHTKRVTEAVV